MTRKKQAKKFDVTKAVKEIARERVGQPRPKTVIEPRVELERKERKHRERMADLLEEKE